MIYPLISVQDDKRRRMHLNVHPINLKLNIDRAMKDRDIPIRCKGILYRDIYHLAERFGIPNPVALARYELGMKPEAIVTRPYGKRIKGEGR